MLCGLGLLVFWANIDGGHALAMLRKQQKIDKERSEWLRQEDTELARLHPAQRRKLKKKTKWTQVQPPDPNQQMPKWTSIVTKPSKSSSFFADNTSFEKLGASPEILQALASIQVTQPSQIQAVSFQPILEGSDAIIADQTGSGKTLAYLAPMVQTLRECEKGEGRTPPGQVRAIVIVPTSELAQQVARVARCISVGGAPFRSAIATGEHKWATQKKQLQGGLELLVATPGRLAAHVDAASFSLSSLRRIVLDEVDVLYEDADFDNIWFDLRDALPPRTAQCFVTATLPPAVETAILRDCPLAKKLSSPGLHRTREGVRQKLIDCSSGSSAGTPEDGFRLKIRALEAELELEPASQVLIFCNTIESCRRVENALCRRDRNGERWELGVFHGALTAEARKQAFQKLIGDAPRASPSLPLLVICTDRASRGMDFPRVQHVVLFDFPRDGVEYVRRVGRVTRGGNAPGRVTSLCLGRQMPYAKKLMQLNEKGEIIDMETNA